VRVDETRRPPAVRRDLCRKSATDGSVTGNVKLDPQEQLPAESPEADLATIRLSDAQAEVLTHSEGMTAPVLRADILAARRG